MTKSSVVDNVSGKSLDSECVLAARRGLAAPLTPGPRTCSIRTSSGMFLRRGQDETIKLIEDRIAAFSMVPAGALLLRAVDRDGADWGTARPRRGHPGAALRGWAEVRGERPTKRVCRVRRCAALTPRSRQAHFDYFHDQLNTQNGGQRVATVLLYLCATAAPQACACERRSRSCLALRSDVEEGGETVFPAATDVTSPEKGALPVCCSRVCFAR
jgi:prolyl 4-hydroxylase